MFLQTFYISNKSTSLNIWEVKSGQFPYKFREKTTTTTKNNHLWALPKHSPDTMIRYALSNKIYIYDIYTTLLTLAAWHNFLYCTFKLSMKLSTFFSKLKNSLNDKWEIIASVIIILFPRFTIMIQILKKYFSNFKYTLFLLVVYPKNIGMGSEREVQWR